MNKRTEEKVGAAIGLIGSIIVAVLMIWQQTKPMQTNASLEKQRSPRANCRRRLITGPLGSIWT